MKMVIKCSACMRNSHTEIEVPPGTIPVCPHCKTPTRMVPKNPPSIFKPNNLPLFGKRKEEGMQT